jgi:hypothetical protein
MAIGYSVQRSNRSAGSRSDGGDPAALHSRFIRPGADKTGSTPTRPDYVEAWEQYRALARKRQQAIISFIVGFLPAQWVLGSVGATVFGSHDGHLGEIIRWGLGFPWGTYVGVRMAAVSVWKCPRCHKRFFTRRFWGNIFTGRCVNCGLPKWRTY